jgi:hypothetical protein
VQKCPRFLVSGGFVFQLAFQDGEETVELRRFDYWPRYNA